MRSRETLIRLHRFKADEAKRKLSAMLAMKADLERKSGELGQCLTDEQRRATENEIGRFAYPTFAKAIVTRRDNIKRSVEEIDRQIEAAREDVNACFRELKKYELIEEQRLRNEQAAEALRVQKDTDEMSLTRFSRTRLEAGH
jgi:flagellar export protein FliJ